MADDIKMVFTKVGPANRQNTNTRLTHEEGQFMYVVKKASFYILNCTVSRYCRLIKQVALRIVGSAVRDGIFEVFNSCLCCESLKFYKSKENLSTSLLLFFCVALLPENEEAFVPHPTQCSCLLGTGRCPSFPLS